MFVDYNLISFKLVSAIKEYFSEFAHDFPKIHGECTNPKLVSDINDYSSFDVQYSNILELKNQQTSTIFWSDLSFHRFWNLNVRFIEKELNRILILEQSLDLDVKENLVLRLLSKIDLGIWMSSCYGHVKWHVSDPDFGLNLLKSMLWNLYFYPEYGNLKLKYPISFSNWKRTTPSFWRLVFWRQFWIYKYPFNLYRKIMNECLLERLIEHQKLIRSCRNYLEGKQYYKESDVHDFLRKIYIPRLKTGSNQRIIHYTVMYLVGTDPWMTINSNAVHRSLRLKARDVYFP